MSLAGRVVRIMLCMQDCKTRWHYRLNFVPFVNIQVCRTFVTWGGGGYLKNEGKMSGDKNDSLVLETHQRNEGKWGGGGGSYLRNEGKMSGDNIDSLVLETHQRNEGKWGG